MAIVSAPAQPQAREGWIEPGRRRWWLSALLLAAGSIVFANAFGGPFLMDDQRAIVDNLTIRKLWPLWSALWGPPQSTVAGRPIVNLSIAINYAVGGTSPVGYHLWNVSIHLLAGLALFGVIRRTLTAPQLAQRFGK